MAILLSCAFLWTFISILLLFIPLIKKHFSFYSMDLWMTYNIGIVFIIGSNFIFFGEQTLQKCYHQHSLLILGYTMVFIPILCKLIINFPKRNKYSEWIKNNKPIFILVIIFIQEIFNLLMLAKSFYIEKIEPEDDKQFRKCKLNTFGTVVTIFQLFFQILIFGIIELLIFLEWNIKETFFDIRSNLVFITINEFLFIIYILLKFLLDIHRYITFYTLNISIILLFVFTNNLYIYHIKICFENMSIVDRKEESFINNLHKYESSTLSSSKNANLTDYFDKTQSSKSKVSTLMTYHNSTFFMD